MWDKTCRTIKNWQMKAKALTEIIIGIILVITIIGNVSAYTVSPEIPSSINLSCDDSYFNSFHFTEGGSDLIINLTEVMGDLSSINYIARPIVSPTAKSYLEIMVSKVPSSVCKPGTATFWFVANGQRYDITVNIKEELHELGTKLLKQGESLSIGDIAHFGIETVGDDKVYYLLSGCGETKEDFIEDSIEATCSGEKVRIELISAFPEPFSVAKFKVYSSEPGLTLTKSNFTTTDKSECVLGLDTLGAKVKRGNIFAIKTINANTGKFEPQVAVTILDQAGELPPISGISSNIGFFSERLYEDYQQNLIVQLEKEGCEPSTQVILFEKSYNDYKTEKETESKKYQLVLNISGKYEINKEISFTVKNALDEAVEGVKVKITKPDNSNFEITTDENGLFKFTPDIEGVWKIQAGKDGYESSRLNEIEIFSNKEYLIVIEADGERKSEYKKGDRLTFKLLDRNNTIIPLTIDATFAGKPLRFINGISDTVTFEGTSTLNIPEVEGYRAQTLTLAEKKTNWKSIIFWIILLIGILVIIVIVIAIINKLKGKRGISGISKALEGTDINLG